mgnify:CR=1 FL=1
MRTASQNRDTAETKIQLSLNIDGSGKADIDTGVPFFDHMLTLFSRHGLFDVELDADGDLELAKGWNAQAGVHWNWTQVWSSNMNIAYANLSDVPESFDADFIKTGGSVHVNLIYKYDERINGGIEFMHGERTNVNNSDGHAQRLQFSLIYYF